jgi:hypothetical protein
MFPAMIDLPNSFTRPHAQPSTFGPIKCVQNIMMRLEGFAMVGCPQFNHLQISNFSMKTLDFVQSPL